MLLVCGALRPDLDGVADSVVRLADALRGHGARVRVLHTGPAGPVPGSRTVGMRWSLRALARAASAGRSADVVHVQFAPSMYRYRIGIGALPALLRGTPLVTTLHEYGWWRWEALIPQPIWRRLERRGVDRETLLLATGSDAVLTTNAAHAAALADRFGEAVPTVVVPIGANVGVAPDVDRERERRELRVRLGLDPETVVLAFFGFVHPVKGVRYLAEAVAELAREGRDVHLLVIGGFTSMALPSEEAAAFEAELRAAIAATGAARRVTITGHRPSEEVSRSLTAADVAVLPFTHGVTAKSGSLLTVLAHRLPTVVTAGPEPEPELVDGERVVVVPAVRDGAALAAGIRRVLDDPALAERIADAGAAWAAEHDWDRIADRHLAVYRRAIRAAG